MNELTQVTQAQPVPKHLPDAQIVTQVKHWTDRLFSFRVTRPQSLRFRSGEFVMIGLLGDNGKPLLRAYSIASPNWDEELEFYSIKVPDGPLTSKLQHIMPDDEIILRPKPVGTLVHDALLPGKRVWFLATGTGIAPFASLMRDPETYEKFDQVIMMHTCREKAELEYGRSLVEGLRDDPLIGDMVAGKLLYYPTTTREKSARMGRILQPVICFGHDFLLSVVVFVIELFELDPGCVDAECDAPVPRDKQAPGALAVAGQLVRLPCRDGSQFLGAFHVLQEGQDVADFADILSG